MSRPILSRPRTRVYGCNYDKGESYYKPMVDHLDRKYSGRPLFSEPRTSLADEIAARRGDIGLSGNRNDYYDDMDYMYDRGIEDDFEDEFVLGQRRQKERAAAAFAEDLAELRRKRRDMQDRVFDVIDLNAEIEKARNTLEQADIAFQRHATKFDNTDNDEDMSSKKFVHLEALSEKAPPKSIKFIKMPNVDIDSYLPQPTKGRQEKVNSILDSNRTEDPLASVALLPLKRRFSNKKKTVSF